MDNNVFNKVNKDSLIKDLSKYDNRAQVEEWTQVYQGNPPWLSNKIPNSLNYAAKIASELSRLTTVELASKVSGDNPRALFLDKQYQRVIDKLKINLEYAIIKGSMVLKPYIDNGCINVEFVHADNFLPLKFNTSGNLIEALFIDTVTKGKDNYIRLEIHEFKNKGNYKIVNKAYLASSLSSLSGKEVSLSTIEDWAHLEPEVNLVNVSQPLFHYFKPPFANNKDANSNLGISIIEKVRDLLEDSDEIYSLFLYEFTSKKNRVFASIDMVDHYLDENGETVTDHNLRDLITTVDSVDKNYIDNYSPEIRDESILNGMNKIERMIEFSVGLAYGTLSDINSVEKTAEEIKSSKERSYNTITDIQNTLKVSLDNLVSIMDTLTDLYDSELGEDLGVSGDYELTFHFDDSIIVDKVTESKNMLDEVSKGVIKPEYYLMKKYGLTLEEAIEMTPSKPSPPVDQPSQLSLPE